MEDMFDPFLVEESSSANSAALASLASAPDHVAVLLRELAIPTVVGVLSDFPIHLQADVAILVSRMAAHEPLAREEFARENAVRPLVSLLSFEVPLDESPAPSTDVVIPVPDSGFFAALGLAERSGFPSIDAQNAAMLATLLHSSQCLESRAMSAILLRKLLTRNSSSGDASSPSYLWRRLIAKNQSGSGDLCRITASPSPSKRSSSHKHTGSESADLEDPATPAISASSPPPTPPAMTSSLSASPASPPSQAAPTPSSPMRGRVRLRLLDGPSRCPLPRPPCSLGFLDWLCRLHLPIAAISTQISRNAFAPCPAPSTLGAAPAPSSRRRAIVQSVP